MGSFFIFVYVCIKKKGPRSTTYHQYQNYALDQRAGDFDVFRRHYMEIAHLVPKPLNV